MKADLVLLALSMAAWAAAFVSYLLGAPLAGTWPIGLYHLYALAAFGGWIVGNLFVRRLRTLAGPAWRLATLYVAGPTSGLFLLYALASRELHNAAPLAPLFAVGVYTVLFMVPVSFHRRPPDG